MCMVCSAKQLYFEKEESHFKWDNRWQILKRQFEMVLYSFQGLIKEAKEINPINRTKINLEDHRDSFNTPATWKTSEIPLILQQQMSQHP